MSTRTLGIVYFILFVVVSIYLLLRAISVPLVHDEAETFFIYFVNFDFLPYQGWVSANNHFLNSFLGAVSYRIFGSAEWAVRLPNILCLPLFGYYLYKLSGLIENEFLRLGLLLALISTSFFIEFFALARGYGMAMALLIPYLYYFTQYLQSKSSRDFFLLLIFGLSCLLASLTCFYIFIIITVLLIIDLFIDRQKGILNSGLLKVLLLLFLHVFPALFFTKYILHLGTINELVVGSLDGFYFVTVAPLIFYLTGSDSLIMVGIFTVIFFLSVLFFIIQFFKNKSVEFFVQPENLFPILLVASMLHIAFNGYILEIPFPRDRAALFLYPLFIFTFCISIDRLNLQSTVKYLASSALLFFPVSLLFNMNLTHSLYWKTKYINPVYYDYILEKSGDDLSTIGSLNLRETIWYHKIFSKEKKLSHLSIKNVETDNGTDFKIQPTDVNPRILENYRLVYKDDIAGNNLYERLIKLERELTDKGPVIPYKGKALYHDFIKYPVQKEQLNQQYLLEIELTIHAAVTPFEFSLYLKLNDKDGQFISDQSIRMSRLKFSWDDGIPYTLIFTLDAVPDQTEEIIAFVYNNNEAEYKLESGSYKLYKLVTD